MCINICILIVFFTSNIHELSPSKLSRREGTLVVGFSFLIIKDMKSFKRKGQC